MCRAFKKPTPNHRQGFEAWSHAYYVRDHNSQLSRPPSFPDFATTAEMVHPNIQAAAATFHDDQPISSAQQEQLVCSHNVLNSQLIELPQLGSPTLSTSLATKEGFHHQHNGSIAIEDFDEERSISSQYIDWRNLDNLLASQFPAGTTSFSHQNLPLISPNIELEAQSNACFPDL